MQQQTILNDIKNTNSNIDKEELFNKTHENFNSNQNAITNKKNISHNQENNTFQKKKNVNPYKWLMEEFEDKNLDKVKRTLLVTLDDISKGFSKCKKKKRKLRFNFKFKNNFNFSI